MNCPACKRENPDSATRCECGYSFTTRDASTQSSQPEKPILSSFERGVYGALIGGFLTAAVLAISARLGNFLERLLPHHGHSILEDIGRRSPEETDRQIESLLSTSGAALAHDHTLVNSLWVIVVGVCVVCVVSAFVYVRRMQSRPVPSGGRTFGMLLLTAFPPIFITSVVNIMGSRLFQTSQLLWRLQIVNTPLAAARYHDAVASLANEYAHISANLSYMTWLSWMSWLIVAAAIVFGTSGLFKK